MTFKKLANSALRAGADALRAMLLMIVVVLYAAVMICIVVVGELLINFQDLDGTAAGVIAFLALVGWLAHFILQRLGRLMNRLVDFIAKPDS